MAEWELRLGHYQEVIAELTELVPAPATMPLPSPVDARPVPHRGRAAEALAVYRSGRRALIDQVGLEPDEELRRLEIQILTGELATSPSQELSPVPRPVPRQLPIDCADFTGREELLDLVEAELVGAPSGGSCPILVLTGGPGVGKSAIALRSGHRISDRFPDGQLYLDLHGHSGRPIPPAEALGMLLRALGHSSTEIPSGQDERASTFRSLLAGRHSCLC